VKTLLSRWIISNFWHLTDNRTLLVQQLSVTGSWLSPPRWFPAAPSPPWNRPGTGLLS